MTQFTGRTGAPAVAGDPISLSQMYAAFATLDGDVSATTGKAAGGTFTRATSARAGDFRGPAEFLASSALQNTEMMLKSAQMDAGPYLQAMANAGSAAIPDGTYRVDTPITLQTGAVLRALHHGKVTLQCTFATGNVITVATGANNVRIEALRFTTTVTRTGGAVIYINGAANTLIADVRTEAGVSFYDFLVIDSGAPCTILERFYLQAITNDAVRLVGYAIDTFIRTGNISGAGCGLHITYASGVYVSDVDIVACSTSGVIIDPSQSTLQNVNSVRLHNVLSDTNQGDGWSFVGTGPITDIDLDFCWGSASGTTGVFTSGQAITLACNGINLNNPLTNGVKINGFQAHSNGGNGIQILQGSNIHIGDGTVCSNNSQAATHTYNGILIGGAATLVTVIGVRSGLVGSQAVFGGAVKQSIGLYRTTGASGHVITVVGCQFPGNYTAGYSILSVSGDLITDVGNVSV